VRLEVLSMLWYPDSCGSLYLVLAASVDFNKSSEKIAALCSWRDLKPQVPRAARFWRNSPREMEWFWRLKKRGARTLATCAWSVGFKIGAHVSAVQLGPMTYRSAGF